MNLGAIGSALKLVAIFPIGFALISGMSGSFIRLTPAIIVQFLFVLWAALSIFWSISIDASLERALSYFLLFLLIFSGTFFRYTESEIKKVKYALAWSSRLTAVIMLIFAEYIEGRFWLKGIIEENPNYLCAYFAFGIVFAIEKLTQNKKIFPKLMAIAELCLYFYLVLVSGSRGGLLAVAAAAIAYSLTFGKNTAKNTFVKIILVVFLFVLFSILLDNLPEFLKERFTVDDVIESGGTGRVDLWKQTFDLFETSSIFRQLFGYGSGTILVAFTQHGYHTVNVAHNIFLENLADLGIVGVALYSIAIFLFIKSSFKEKDKFSFSVICCMFVLSLSASLATFKPYFNIMLFIIMLQNLQSTEQINTKTAESRYDRERKYANVNHRYPGIQR